MFFSFSYAIWITTGHADVSVFAYMLLADIWRPVSATHGTTYLILDLVLFEQLRIHPLHNCFDIAQIVDLDIR